MIEQCQHSFLLRVWRSNAGAPWRAYLIDVARPDERYHFTSFDELSAYIEDQIEPMPISTSPTISDDPAAPGNKLIGPY